MEKRIIILLSIMLIFAIGTCQAASYTLPEKMYNQLAIGSGLKGTFSIHAEGNRFRTEFVDAVSNADFSIRGILSEGDLHYYVFQTDEKEQQSAVSELYRKNGKYYFRSDLVQGRTISLPDISQFLDMIIPANGENGSSSAFVSKIITLSDEEKQEKWNPVLNRYQNDLELWLAEFTVNAETVKLENGFSAVDFSYEIPFEKVIEKIMDLTETVSKDAEASALLDTVMTAEEKRIYMNPNLLYFYKEALESSIIAAPIRLNRRVSAMGDMLSFSLDLPMHEESTGFQSILIEKIENKQVYTIRKTGEVYILAMPDLDSFQQSEYNQSVWLTCIHTDDSETEQNNFAVRADIQKTYETYDNDDESHEIQHYVINVQEDLETHVPEDLISFIPEFEPIQITADLHYHSLYPQNAATVLEINAKMMTMQSVESDQESSDKKEAIKDNSSISLYAKEIKTAKPWTFMPFDVDGAEDTAAGNNDALKAYFQDWIKNASISIKHTVPGSIQLPEEEKTVKNEDNSRTETEGTADAAEISDEAESAPLEETEQE